MKRLTAMALLAAMLLALVPSAMGETTVGNSARSFDGDSELFYVIDFKFHHYEKGIGFGSLPVYTAPSLDAYRCANGKASCDTNAGMFVGGFDAASRWLLVRYETNDGGVRVGYVPRSEVSGFKTDIDPLKFSYIPQTAVEAIEVTDNPLNKKTSAFAVLQPGDAYYILGKYTYYGNWWYIECTVNGQVARGFINRDTTKVDKGDGIYTTDLGTPPRSPQGKARIGMVTVVGEAKIVRQNAGAEYEMVARVNDGEQYAYYDTKTGTNGNLWYYIFVDGVWGWTASMNVRAD